MYGMVALVAVLLVVLPSQAFSGMKCTSTGNCNVVVAPARMCQWPVVPERLPQTIVVPERLCLYPVVPERTCTKWVQEPCPYPKNRNRQTFKGTSNFGR